MTKDSVSIDFTGTVERVVETPSSRCLVMVVDEGRQYPGRADVWCTGGIGDGIGRGARVAVTCATMPRSGKVYKAKDGTDKAWSPTFNAVNVNCIGQAEPDTEASDSTEIPF